MMNSDYQFVSTDTEALLALLISGYETLANETMQPASPERLMVLWVADAIIQTLSKINYAANQNIPSRARAENLDTLSELFYGKERPGKKAATCIFRFHISEAQTSSILIPANTRVTDSSATLYWATEDDAYIPIGETFADVPIFCQTLGAIGNGYTVGQVSRVVDLFPYCKDRGENITESDGGSDKANDKQFYQLLRESQDAYSVAGPMGAYVYWAKTVSTDIVDVKAILPKQTHSETLSVYARHAFFGGEGLVAGSLVVFPQGSNTPATAGVDYWVDFTNNLLKIELLESGTLASAVEIDISIQSIMAGHVHIYALMKDGTIASETVKERIFKACNDDEVRPLTDLVSVEDPGIVDYNIEFTYYIPTDATQSGAEIQQAVENAVDNFIKWQSEKLGRDINPSKLHSLLMETGIKRVDLIQPGFVVLEDGDANAAPEIAKVVDVDIKSGGYENE